MAIKTPIDRNYEPGKLYSQPIGLDKTAPIGKTPIPNKYEPGKLYAQPVGKSVTHPIGKVRPSKPNPPVWNPAPKKPKPAPARVAPKPVANKPKSVAKSPTPIADFARAGKHFAKSAVGERKGTYNNPTVAKLQGKLGITQDGDFGPQTKAALKAYQSRHGLHATGILDANTKAKLGMAPKGSKKGLNPAPNFQEAARRMLSKRKTLANTR